MTRLLAIILWIANNEKERHTVASGFAKGLLLEIVVPVLRVSTLNVNAELGTRFRDLIYYTRRVVLNCEIIHSGGDRFPTGPRFILCS